MKTYEFYENGKTIARFTLYDEDEAKNKAIELSFSLSYAMKNPKITYKEISNGEEKII